MIFGTNNDLQYEEGKTLSANEAVHYKQSISSVKIISSLWQAAKIS